MGEIYYDSEVLDDVCEQMFGHTDWEYVEDKDTHVTIKFNVEDTREEETKFCPHRYEVTFQIGVIGIGKTKDEAIKEARMYGLDDITNESFTEVSTELSNDMDTCDICEEEE